MQTNEFRVRPVTRFQLTHYQRDEGGPHMEVHLLGDRSPRKISGSSRTVGEFDSVEAAEEVGVALQALVPGSTLETVEGRQAAYPPKALAAAMAVRQEAQPRRVRVGDVIPVIVTNEGDVQNMRVTCVEERQLTRFLECTFPPGMFLNGYGTGRVLDEQPWRLLANPGLSASD